MSLYWKCQIIIWILFSSLVILFPSIVFGYPIRQIIADLLSFKMIFAFVKFIIAGLIVSHIMKRTIKKLGVLEKSLVIQIPQFFLLTFIFSIILFAVCFFLLGWYKFFFRYQTNVRYALISQQGLTFLIFLFTWNLLFFTYHYIKRTKVAEKQKEADERKMLELEVITLRAQMNPHFIFNCLNSMKALIQQNENNKAITYLTTFSKLIRVLFQNSDKKRVSLFDEIEYCRLYTELECMRMNGSLQYLFNIEDNLDLKSVMVPALIIQPFIENSIWHGIAPRGSGILSLGVKRTGDIVICEIEDDGIGRELSKQNKTTIPEMHVSKGINISQARMDLEEKLYDVKGSIETIDKIENGECCGTKVVLSFKLN